jgi:flagellar FliL protein
MADKDETEAAAGGGKKKLLMIIVVLAVLGGAAFFFLKPGGDAAAAAGAPSPSPSHEAGPVVELEPVTINLAGGHYLKLGMALQTTPDAASHGDVSGALALDAAIELFSNMTIDELADAEGREHAKEELVKEVEELYHHGVYDIYFTEFVMQ